MFNNMDDQESIPRSKEEMVEEEDEVVPDDEGISELS